MAQTSQELVGTALKQIRQDALMNDAMLAMLDRREEFTDAVTPLLAGVAMNPLARQYFEGELDREFERVKGKGRAIQSAQEVIVGGGLHAAIYATARVAQGMPCPLVIEKGRVGGIFAISQTPSFYLNSRNRPGPLSLPGEGMGLNVIPGAPVQPAHISSSEFQRNSDLAFAIRCALAMNAIVVKGEVTKIGKTAPNSLRRIKLTLSDRREICASRVIIAAGLGATVDKFNAIDGERVLSFEQFMARMDSAFPLQGLGRVAVIGAGDSGKTVIEALTGQGPSEHFSMAALDYSDAIDWYGLRGGENCGTFTEIVRGRYRRIAALLPTKTGEQARVRPMKKAELIRRGFDCAYVDGKPYDTVIVCAGMEFEQSLIEQGQETWFGRRATDLDVYALGPCSNLPLSARENALTDAYTRDPANTTALFRYGPLTSAFACDDERQPAKSGPTKLTVDELKAFSQTLRYGRGVLVSSGSIASGNLGIYDASRFYNLYGQLLETNLTQSERYAIVEEFKPGEPILYGPDTNSPDGYAA